MLPWRACEGAAPQGAMPEWVAFLAALQEAQGEQGLRSLLENLEEGLQPERRVQPEQGQGRAGPRPDEEPRARRIFYKLDQDGSGSIDKVHTTGHKQGRAHRAHRAHGAHRAGDSMSP